MPINLGHLRQGRLLVFTVLTLAACQPGKLIGAYLLFALACALGIAPLMVATGQPHRALEFVQLWVWFGVPTVFVLATIVGPGLLGVDRLLNRGLSIAVAAAIGASVGPVLLLVAWLVMRESNESFQGLLQFWWRVPGEFLIGVLPPAAAGSFFCVWLIRKSRRLPPALMVQ